MPNWCSNSLTLSGPQAVLQEIADTGFSFTKLMPYPKEMEGIENVYPPPAEEVNKRARLNEKYGVDNLYDWCVKNWGTKWDVTPSMPLEIEPIMAPENLFELIIDFDSAWSPPVGVIKFIYDNYKDRGLSIHMEYFEPACAFLGTVTAENGEFKDIYYDYQNVDELEKYSKELGHYLSECEIEYLREQETENE